MNAVCPACFTQVVTITHEQNITHLGICIGRPFSFCGQLFASHVVDFRANDKEEKMHQMIYNNYSMSPRWI